MRDNDDENSLLSTLITGIQRVIVHLPATAGMLQNLATKDLATESIQDSLLRAQELGQ